MKLKINLIRTLLKITQICRNTHTVFTFYRNRGTLPFISYRCVRSISRKYLVPTIYDSLFRSASGTIDNGHNPHARSRSRKQRGR